MAIYIMRRREDETYFKVGRAKDSDTALAAARRYCADAYVADEKHKHDKKEESKVETHLHHSLSEFRSGWGSTSKECYASNEEGKFLELVDEYYNSFVADAPMRASVIDYQSVQENEDLEAPLSGSDEMKALCIEYEKAKVRADAEKHRVEMLAQKIKGKVGRSRGVDGILDWKVSTSNRFNKDILDELHPGAYDACKRPSPSRASFKLTW